MGVTVFDLTVARLVRQAKLLERACHDPGPWSVRVDGVDTPLVKVVGNSGVLFVATFPPVCWLATGPRAAELLCDGQVLDARIIDMPAEGPFTLEWTIRLTDREVVAA